MTEQFQRRASKQWTSPLPTWGRRQGGGEREKLGPRDGIPYHKANMLPVSNQRLPEILDGWHLVGRSQLDTSSPEQAQGAPNRRAWKLRLGPWRGEGAPHLGRVACQAPGGLSCSGWGRHKTQAQSSPRFCGVPENWNCTQLRARSLESSLEPEQCRQGKHTPMSGGKPSVARTLRVLPTQASDICLQCPSLPTARLSKRT